jgi:transcriptional regulator with XRE-family HTH domain
MNKLHITKPLLKIGRKLKTSRVKKKITLETAARAFRISVIRLDAIERGEKNYNLSLLVKMCEYYNVSVLDVV